MTFSIPDHLQFLARALRECGIPLYAVGGIVRDQVLGCGCEEKAEGNVQAFSRLLS